MGRCHVFLRPTRPAAAHTALGVANTVDHLGVGIAIAWRSAFSATTDLTILGLGAVAENVASFDGVEALAIAATTTTATATGRVVKLGRPLVQLGAEYSKRVQDYSTDRKSVE